MVKRWRQAGRWECAGLLLAACCALTCSAPAAQAQAGIGAAPARERPIKERMLPEHFPPTSTAPPKWTLPVDPLGFSPPGAFYLGSGNALVSLDFMGEDKLLFTFRAPGLLHRDAANGADSDERQIRAVVLDLPQGTVEAERVWTLHDQVRYLWMLNDGHFLLRDGKDLLEGDATLNTKPFLEFPGPLLWVEADPSQQFLVTDSHEPAQATAKPGEVGSPATASAGMSLDDEESGSTPETVVRILRRDTGKVMLVSRVRSTVHLPINSSGYLEDLRGRGWEWMVNLSFFSGGSRMLGNVVSNCEPSDDFVSEREILVSACTSEGGDRLVAMTTEGRTLWADQTPAVAIWPKIAMAPNGLRVARETLGVSHPVNAYAPLDADEIKGQWVTVYDAATGDMALETPASPAFDSGGNVAISPSGRRVAVLNAGAIQIFELPAAPPLPEAANTLPGK